MGIFGNFVKKFKDDLEEYRKANPKKEWHDFRCEVKGHFLPVRQRVLSRAFRDSYDPEYDDHDETLLSDCLEFISEPDNEYDSNAIGIHIRTMGQIGYIPKDQTGELKETIHLDQDFKSYLTIYREGSKYFADLQVLQKY